MSSHPYIASQYSNLTLLAERLRQEYAECHPFPHVTIDSFFREDILDAALESFPDLSKDKASTRFNNNAEIKLASTRGDKQQSDSIRHLLRYLNSSEFLDFLQQLTSIKEPLIPDPHFLGGGLHEIKNGGLLKIHADFCRHDETRLDRRINLLIYLNKNWAEEFGGHLQLWDKEMKTCEKKILPVYNRIVIFNTTDFTFHGHPDPVICPPQRSRKSLALYYYSNGRPDHELRPSQWNQSTLFKERPGEEFLRQTAASRAKLILRSLVPPAALSAYKKVAKSIRH
jgi:Rps23 Pro-64 3,4-dihydroxylase Tpa1-like proline 4-hydroxylase